MVHEGERKEKNNKKPALCMANKQADCRGGERRLCAAGRGLQEAGEPA